ncbi:tetratricopeptide repeat protein, partial [Myxococcota bacterium]|nr:tetratricopeptide repeat protein [Myxococcota bacterium]
VASIFILFLAAKASWADRGLNALVLLGGVAILVVPMTWADWSVRGDLRLLKTPLSYHLYQGVDNGSGRSGLYQPPINGNFAADFLADHLGHFPTTAEMSDFYDQQIETRASAGQGNSVGGFLRRLLLSLDATEPFDTQEAWLHAEHSKFLNGLLEIVTFGWILPLAFFGAWVVWPERSRLSWLYGWSFFWLSWSVVFYHYGRHRLMLVPILLLFAAAGLLGASQFVRSRPRWVVASAIVSTAVILWVSQGTLVRADVERSLAYHGVASGLAELGLEELATLRMEDALDFDSDNAFAHHDLGALYAQRRWYGAAANHFSEAVRVRPDYEQAYRNLAEAQYASFESAQAAETYKALLRLQPQNADAWFELGRTQLDAGQFDEAQVSFRRSMALKSGSAAPPAQ